MKLTREKVGNPSCHREQGVPSGRMYDIDTSIYEWPRMTKSPIPLRTEQDLGIEDEYVMKDTKVN